MAKQQGPQLNDQKLAIRQQAEADLSFFCRLMNPHRVYGQLHDDMIRFLTKPDAADNQLVLIPRAHMKSHIIAMWVAWWITKHPDTSVLYVSATERLAITQLYAIKQVLESPQYQRYWPEMLARDEGKREKWSAKEIIVDHPLRKERQVRDSTCAVASVGTNTTGLHCDVLVFDDIVVPDNAYSEIGRTAVSDAYSQFSSILNPGGTTKAVGTRYHPADIYAAMKEEEVPIFNEETGELIEHVDSWEVMEEVAEEDGIFLWPREQHPETKLWFGFDRNILASIKSKYKNPAHFHAQYYNDPNDPDSHRVTPDKFIYGEQKLLKYEDGVWYYKDKRLNVFAGMDVAWTEGSRSDYTAIVVIGLDAEGFIYVLDMRRFKTSDFLKYYQEVEALHRKWNFRKLRVETNSGGKLVEQELRNFIRRNGDSIIVDGKHATQHEGKKWERHAAVLEHRYMTSSVMHFRGGLTGVLEEEIMLERPAHDDLEDALCGALEISIVPSQRKAGTKKRRIATHTRFGGVLR